MNIQPLVDLIKSKKNVRRSIVDEYFANHPHRLELVTFSGSSDLTVDEKVFTGAGLSASVHVLTVDYSLLDPWARVLNDAFPFYGSFVLPNQGEFYLAHRRIRFWDMVDYYGSSWSSVVIGSVDVTAYTRPSTLDPWVAGSTTTTDITAISQIAFDKGGDVDSGGYTADVLGEITTSITTSGAGSTYVSNLSISGLILRDPKNDTWAAESAIFSDNFTDLVSDLNAIYGGGCSGSTDFTVTFT